MVMVASAMDDNQRCSSSKEEPGGRGHGRVEVFNDTEEPKDGDGGEATLELNIWLSHVKL